MRVLQETARRISKVSNESGIAIVEDEYVQSFKIEMMDVVLQWCKGAKFSDICKLTDVFEGSVIRCFRRLQELLRQMGMAAGAIGNTELEQKFAKSLDMLERPNTVVFNPSYVTCLMIVRRSISELTIISQAVSVDKTLGSSLYTVSTCMSFFSCMDTRIGARCT